MSKTEEQMYQEMAELKLQNRMLSERLDMMTRMVNHLMDDRADLCQQLEQRGLAITINNHLVQVGD